MVIILALLTALLAGVNVEAYGARTAPDRKRLLDIFARADSTINIRGNYPEAMEMYLEFISGAEGDAKLEPQLVKAYLWVAVIYGSFNDADNAIVYNKEAYALARKLGNTAYSELAMTNLAQSYRASSDFDNASRTADSLLTLNAGVPSKTLLFRYAITKGEIAFQQGHNAEALGYFRQADSVARAEGLPRYERASPLEMIACYYERINLPDSQQVYLERAWQLLEADNDPQPKAECARLLMTFHIARGNMEQAQRFQEEYFRLTDLLVNMQRFLSVSSSYQQSRMASKGMEIDHLNREALYHKVIIAVIALFLLMAITAIVIIVRQKRHLAEAYSTLFEKDKRLMGLTSEQEPKLPDPAAADSELSPRVAKGEDAPRDEQRNRILYNRIVAAMENSREYLNPDFGLSNLVAVAGSNVAYVTKVVKQYSGQNVPSFINEYRVREACRRILDEENFGNITFAAIGESVGFNSQVSFNRTFKKVTGMTPSLYHKMAARERRNG